MTNKVKILEKEVTVLTNIICVLCFIVGCFLGHVLAGVIV